MLTKFKLKKNLETNITQSQMSSCGMSVLHCNIDIDDIGKITLNIAINNGGLPREHVEDLIMRSFESVGMAAFVKGGEWQDLDVSHEQGVARVVAYGFRL